jgi:type II restriction/modification system DNA methylase subunit YeeA
MASFDGAMRSLLLLACRFNWSKISPAVFGSMFQSVMKPDERHQIGAHYTSEKNIMKVIRPLFVDELEAELSEIKNDERALRAFTAKLRTLTFFDPSW